MNWPRKRLFSVLAVVFWVAGCGVKGDPLPPEKPVELGRGRPTYRRATEGLQIEKNKPANAKPATVSPRKVDDEDEDDEQE